MDFLVVLFTELHNLLTIYMHTTRTCYLEQHHRKMHEDILFYLKHFPTQQIAHLVDPSSTSPGQPSEPFLQLGHP